MILTETLFRKIISFAAPQETECHTEVMAQASAVLKGAHRRGVELEYVLEVRRRCPRWPRGTLSAATLAGEAGRVYWRSVSLRSLGLSLSLSDSALSLLYFRFIFP